MASIYSYSDYREYLKDQLSNKRQNNRSFSVRSAAAKLGIGSGTLSRVLNGSRHIGPNLLPDIITFLGLKTREAEYFKLMVQFARTNSPGRKRDVYESMLRLRTDTRIKISEDQYRLFEEWYHLALHQLLRIESGCSDPTALGAMLEPPISASKTRKALEFLKRNGLIKPNGQGGYAPVDTSLTTGEVWQSVAIHGFQAKAATMAASALNTIPREERDFSTLTVGLSADGFITAREILRKARQEILALDEQESNPERVYQFNLQAFPISKKPVGGESS